MRAFLALAATALSLALPGNAAHAVAGPGRVVPCGFSVFGNPFGDGGRQVAVLGPAAVVIADGTDPRSGRVVCSLQWGDRHGDPDLVSYTSVTTAGVVAMPATTAEYLHPEEQRYVPSVCTSVEIDGAGTFHLDAETRRWTTSPLGHCSYFHYREDPLTELPYEMLDDVDHVVEDEVDPVVSDLNAFVEDEVDPVVCPLLAAQAPGAGPVVVEPEGDVYAADTFVWDCPPYEEGTR